MRLELCEEDIETESIFSDEEYSACISIKPVYECYIKKSASFFFLEIILYQLDDRHLLCLMIARVDIDARGLVDHEDISVFIEDAGLDIYCTLELESTWFIYLYVF